MCALMCEKMFEFREVHRVRDYIRGSIQPPFICGATLSHSWGEVYMLRVHMVLSC